MSISIPKDESVVVRTPDEFLAMPERYREITIHEMAVNAEGEPPEADDYVQVYLSLAPTAEEPRVCAERSVEEYDHYKIGKAVLARIGVDTSPMAFQTLEDLELDSLDLVDLAQFLQRDLSLPIGRKGFAQVDTVGELVRVRRLKVGLG